LEIIFICRILQLCEDCCCYLDC